MAEDKKTNNGLATYPTDDLYFMAAVKALCGIDYDEIVIVEADWYGKKEKCTAIYKNRNDLPRPSKIKLICGDKSITLRQFTEAFIMTKREIFRILDLKGQQDGKKQERPTDRPADGSQQRQTEKHPH